MDRELLETCYQLFEMSGFKIVPNPMDVIALPAGYVGQLYRFHHAVRFFEDFDKRPPELKE